VSEVTVKGDTVAQVLRSLEERYPQLTRYLRDENGAIRPIVNVYVNDEHVRFRQGLQTPLRDGDQVYVVPLVMGG
jgi:molybdopterin synthase sulfur carrier subunit